MGIVGEVGRVEFLLGVKAVVDLATSALTLAQGTEKMTRGGSENWTPKILNLQASIIFLR